MESENIDCVGIQFKKLDSVLKKIETSCTSDIPDEFAIRDTLDLHVLGNEKKRSLADMLKDIEEPFNRLATSHKNPVLAAVEEKKARLLENLEAPLNEYFKDQLKYHQLEGIEFMWNRVYKQREGCLLSHAMGLGKSVQTVALLTTLYENLSRNPNVAYPTRRFFKGKKVLLLAPLITLANWENEFRKWYVKGFSTVLGQVYNFAETGYMRKDNRTKYLEYWSTHGGIMLMNYDQLRAMLLSSSNKEEHYRLLVNPGPDVAILDEGHRIRNATSQISQIVSEFRTHARICLTGYPLQNHLLEYYCMLDFVAPGILGPPESFKSYFTFYIEKSYADSSSSVKANARIKLYILQLLTDKVTHRRDTMTIERDLPSKTEYVVTFKMTDIQRLAYIQALVTMEHHGSFMDNVFVLRTICNHPKIFQKLLIKRKSKKRERQYVKEANEHSEENYASEDNGSVNLDIDESADIDEEGSKDEDDEENIVHWDDEAFHWTIEYFKNDEIEAWNCSNKISFIVDLVMECKVVQEKVLIVSHSISCLDYLQHLFSVIGIQISRVDGATFSNERQSTIDDFNSDKKKLVMLLSAKAAAIGVNVTGANRIVLIDQDWNPLYDEQSIGRIYRYGQSKPVVVYRLITASTIEQRIFAQSLHKRSISNRLIDNKVSVAVSKEDVKDYYVRPELTLPLASMDDIRNNLQPDFITFSSLFQNKDYITECSLYDIEAVNEHDPKRKLSKAQQKEAVAEATEFIKRWQTQRKYIYSTQL